MLMFVNMQAVINVTEQVTGENDMCDIAEEIRADETLEALVPKYIFEHWPEVIRYSPIATTVSSLHGGWCFKLAPDRKAEQYIMKRLYRSRRTLQQRRRDTAPTPGRQKIVRLPVRRPHSVFASHAATLTAMRR